MRAAAAFLTVAVAACSSPEDAGAPPATPDEQRALAEAESMIPASERPAATSAPTIPPTESAKP